MNPITPAILNVFSTFNIGMKILVENDAVTDGSMDFVGIVENFVHLGCSVWLEVRIVVCSGAFYSRHLVDTIHVDPNDYDNHITIL